MKNPVLTIIVLAVLLPGCSGPTSTPEDTFRAYADAMKKGDHRTATQYLTQDAQDAAAASLVSFGLRRNALRQGERSNDEINAIFLKYGFNADKVKSLRDQEFDSSKESISKLVQPITDKPGFVGEMMEQLKKSLPTAPPTPPELKLSDLKISGDSGSAKISFSEEGREIKAPIQFRKEKGAWRIQPPAPQR